MHHYSWWSYIEQHPNSTQNIYIENLVMMYIIAWAQAEAEILVLRLGPKMNTKVAFNTTHHHRNSKLVDQFQS